MFLHLQNVFLQKVNVHDSQNPATMYPCDAINIGLSQVKRNVFISPEKWGRNVVWIHYNSLDTSFSWVS